MSWSEWDQNGGLEFVEALDELATQIIHIGDELVCTHRQLAGDGLVGAAVEWAAAFEAQIAAITKAVRDTNSDVAAAQDFEISRGPIVDEW